MSDLLQRPVSSLANVGQAREKHFNSLNIFTLKDVLYHFPRRYEDRQILRLDEIDLYTTCAVRLKIASELSYTRIRGGTLSMIKCSAAEVLRDDFGVFYDNSINRVELTYFHSDYLRNVFKPGNIYVFYGKISGNLTKFEMVNPKFIPIGAALEGNDPPRFYPIYKKNSKVSQPLLQRTINAVLDIIDEETAAEIEIFPNSFMRKYNLSPIIDALRIIHSPSDAEALELAKRRLIFEEFFLYSLALEIIKSRRVGIPGYQYKREVDMGEFYAALPFKLTNAQQRAIDETLSDMQSGKPMSRLVQGDVGSGKTVIAAAAAYFACKNNTQTAMMAPTDILATQHFESLSELFAKFGMTTVLLTGNLKAAQKREALKLIESGEADFIIGTHAVIQKSVNFKNLSLAITDEQHRFGVNQRALLSNSSETAETPPHALVMSATPIPRTLALIMYGDLDVSIVNESPPGRQKVETYAVDSSYRERINAFTRKLIDEGGQVYIVCPLVGEDEEDSDTVTQSDASDTPKNPAGGDMKSVKAYYKELSEKIFPDIASGFVHGKLKASEKDAIMERFRSGEVKILVSTVVIEVGVNVPNAVLMIIENAERFGLSQLHQLRGRVGRGEKKSYCVLFSDHDSEKSGERLDIMTKTNDGFEIAKKDIEIRGPGDLFGEKQSGAVHFKIANLTDNADILYEASRAAKEFAADLNTLTDDMERETRAKLVEAAAHMFEDGEIAFN